MGLLTTFPTTLAIFLSLCHASSGLRDSRTKGFLHQDPEYSRITSISSRADKDQITDLPGVLGDLKSKHYSGYIPVGHDGSKQLFYYFIESEGSPEDDPVVLWLNGGPGCSSFDGFIYEMGPFKFNINPDAKNGPNVHLSENPWAWNKVANMIFVDSPVGVGLSYSNQKSDYITGDTQTARDAEEFLRGFFKRFPAFQENDFYISGESYAGIYVPNLARAVAEGNDAGSEPFINIVGYMVGNGVTDSEVDGDAYVPFAAGKSLISREQHRNLLEACDGVFWNKTYGSLCSKLYTEMEGSLAGLNVYDVLQDCFHTTPTSREAYMQVLALHTGTWPIPGAASRVGRALNYRHLGLNPPCTDTRLADIWLNDPDVRKAIHAASINDIGRWEICSGEISYSREISSTIPIHRNLTLKWGLAALIYSGDHDLAVPHTGSERWTSELKFPIREVWGPWFTADHQVAGYSIEYEGLTYATIKGAGHMVPQTNPRDAFVMFNRFVSGESLRGGKPRHSLKQTRVKKGAIRDGLSKE